ncbi:MAG: pyridoxamine 5'-phosphate oxidase [Rhodospirillaceae bacterium]|nr:pyridoxamine 5'-phosphate oxidase [Rhodospirillaceae bacterium]|tara:strand:+ start:128 stop:724 length:597 start_codon:yes stop_codon:yes gene_type:complete
MFEPDSDDPIELFGQWFYEAEKSEPNDANAMSLATVSNVGLPSARVVLMKEYDNEGFVFYTNLKSRKSKEFLQNTNVAVCFHWKSMHRQVRIEGTTSLVTSAEADSYFASRPRASQLGAWASRQSEPLTSREELLSSLQKFEKKYGDNVIPRPPHWGGVRISPLKIEFWQDGDFRLHDRFLYKKKPNGLGWEKARLYP